VELKEDIKNPSEKYSHKNLPHRGKTTS